MQSLLASAATVVMGIALAFFAVEKACALREEYVMQSIIIEKDRDFLEKCQTPEGYASMNHHPNFCEKILASARTGAFWHAVRVVAGSLQFDQALQVFERLSWKVAAFAALLFLLVPTLLIRQSRVRRDAIPYYCEKMDVVPYYCEKKTSCA